MLCVSAVKKKPASENVLGTEIYVHYSVFECQLSEKEYHELRRRLEPLIQVDESDSLRFYSLCGDCQQQIEHFGGHAARADGALIL